MPSGAIISFLLKYRYAALFPLACFEGPIFSLVVGFLISLGYFSFFPAYIVLIFGDLVPDTVYYYIGRYGHKKDLLAKYSKRSKLLAQSVPHLSRLWHEQGRKTMFWSKLAYGLSTPFLISAGLVKLPVQKFWSYAIPVTLIQYALIMTIGYFLGNSYQSASHYISGLGIVVALIVVIAVVYFFVRKIVVKEIEVLEEETV